MARRLVAIGFKTPYYPTISIKVDTHDNAEAVAAGLPSWGDPKAPLPQPDDDLLRKQQIEDGIARGDDL